MKGKNFKGASPACGAALLLASVLSACGGDGEITLKPPTDTVPSRISGVLGGNATRGGSTRTMAAVVNDGRFMAIDSGLFFDGTFNVSGGQVSSDSVGIYAGDPFGRAFIRQITEIGTLSAKVTTSGWSGTITGPSTGTTQISLAYDLETDTQDSSLTFIDGDWLFNSGTSASALTIQSSGTTATSNSNNGSPTFCDSIGSASLIDANYGEYAWQTTVSGGGCGGLATSPTYTGFGFLADGTEPLDRLTVLLANANYFLAYSSYQRQP